MALVGQMSGLDGLCRYVTKIPLGDLVPIDVIPSHLLCYTSLGLGLDLALGSLRPWTLPWTLDLGPWTLWLALVLVLV